MRRKQDKTEGTTPAGSRRFLSVGMTAKLSAMVICSVVAACIAIGTTGYFAAEEQLAQEASSKLVALNAARSKAIASYLSAIEEDIASLALSSNARDAALMFSSAWDSIDKNHSEYLQKNYIEKTRTRRSKKKSSISRRTDQNTATSIVNITSFSAASYRSEGITIYS